jgi:3-keto-5-aminohexanoate cleavage enzyme
VNFKKLIINVALTGIIPTKDQNPFVPLTPQEIARDAKKVSLLGASIIHIHAREKDGVPTYKKKIYKEIIERIRDACDDIIITVSTSGRRTKNIAQRMEVLGLDGVSKPDMASLTLGSMNFKEDFSLNPPETIAKLIKTMQHAGIKPELEIFDTGMAAYAGYLFKNKYFEGLHYANLILGSLGTMAATPKHLVHLVDELHEEIIWGATGVGQFAFGIQRLSIAMGGHVRVGLEDSIYMDAEKRELATNEKLVMRVRKVAEAIEREIATTKEVRKLLMS